MVVGVNSDKNPWFTDEERVEMLRHEIEHVVKPQLEAEGIKCDITVELNTGGSQAIGQLQIARFVNPSGLQSLGQNLMKETPASGTPQVLQPGQGGAGALVQGSLEASNVNVVEEMVNMIETQRAYEINSKAISAVDGMLRFLNNNM